MAKTIHPEVARWEAGHCVSMECECSPPIVVGTIAVDDAAVIVVVSVYHVATAVL